MSFITATAPVRVSSSAQAVAPASSSAAAAPASSAQAASSSQAAATTQATSAAAAAATSAAATASSSAAAAAAPSSSRASSSAAAASSSVASSSSAAASSSSTAAPSSASSASASRSSPSSSSAFFAGSSDSQNMASSNSTLPGKTIGAIAGGVVGGIAILALAFICWRRLKARRNRVPPPPPRDMSFNPAASATRSRAVSGGMMESGLALGAGGMHRENSFATLLPNNPSAQMSRQPSYYTNYPIATPSTSDGSPPDTSPEFNPVEDSAMIGAAAGAIGERPASRNSRRITSVDRLRMEAMTAGSRNALDRPSSPSSMNFPSPHPAPLPLPEGSAPEGSITPPSPSYPYLSNSRGSSSPMLGHRPGSMSSLSSRGYNYLHVGPARGAPHQGRPIQLEMPRPLSSNPNDLGMSPSSPMNQTGEWGNNSNKRWSGGLGSTNDHLPNPFPQSPQSPTYQQSRRIPSSQSMGGMTNSQSSRIRTSGSYQPTLGSMSGYEQQH